MEHKKIILFRFALLPIFFFICAGFFASCVTMTSDGASNKDKEEGTVVEKVIEIEESSVVDGIDYEDDEE